MHYFTGSTFNNLDTRETDTSKYKGLTTEEWDHTWSETSILNLDRSTAVQSLPQSTDNIFSLASLSPVPSTMTPISVLQDETLSSVIVTPVGSSSHHDTSEEPTATERNMSKETSTQESPTSSGQTMKQPISTGDGIANKMSSLPLTSAAVTSLLLSTVVSEAATEMITTDNPSTSESEPILNNVATSRLQKSKTSFM